MDALDGAAGTVAVAALKSGRRVKSRLVTLPEPLRQRLAWAMAVDTLRALSAAVDRVVVVSGQLDIESRLAAAGLAATVLAEPEPAGLNAALRHGDDVLRADGVRTVLACVADLPALRPSTVTRVLMASRAAARSFVPDASGIGTTMLVAHDHELAPAFSGQSARRHQLSGALRLTDDLLGFALDARRDVDTESDLVEAARLGLGTTTANLFDGQGRLVGRT